MHKYSCGYHQSSNSFSMLFTMPYDQQQHICPCDNSNSSFSNNVDCTLSLATPSTRLITSSDYYDSAELRLSSRFCWDFLHSDNQHPAPPPPPSSYKAVSNRGGATTVDSLLARRCASCDTTSTPLWRNGPRGPKSLCNACGIRFKKEERRAAMTAFVSSGGDGTTDRDDKWMNMNSSATHKLRSCYSPAAAVGGEFKFIDDMDDRDSSFLSWRLNVTDRPGLVHDFTRY